jgi:hypothetical protein
VTGVSSAIILRQHAEIETLQARQVPSTIDRLIAQPDPAPTAEAPPEKDAGPAVPAQPQGVLTVVAPDGEVAQQRPGPRNRGANRFAEILADPEISLLMKNQQKAELDGRYAAIFKRLGLSGPEVEALKELLAEKQLARMETRAVAHAEGYTGQRPRCDPRACERERRRDRLPDRRPAGRRSPCGASKVRIDVGGA